MKKILLLILLLPLFNCIGGAGTWTGKKQSDPYLISLSPLKYTHGSKCEAVLTIKSNSNINYAEIFGSSLRMYITITDRAGVKISTNTQYLNGAISGLKSGEITKKRIEIGGIFLAKKNCPTANVAYVLKSHIKL